MFSGPRRVQSREPHVVLLSKKKGQSLRPVSTFSDEEVSVCLPSKDFQDLVPQRVNKKISGQ